VIYTGTIGVGVTVLGAFLINVTGAGMCSVKSDSKYPIYVVRSSSSIKTSTLNKTNKATVSSIAKMKLTKRSTSRSLCHHIFTTQNDLQIF